MNRFLSFLLALTLIFSICLFYQNHQLINEQKECKRELANLMITHLENLKSKFLDLQKIDRSAKIFDFKIEVDECIINDLEHNDKITFSKQDLISTLETLQNSDLNKLYHEQDLKYIAKQLELLKKSNLKYLEQFSNLKRLANFIHYHPGYCIRDFVLDKCDHNSNWFKIVS